MKKINLLIIDDDELNLFIISRTIEKTGYEVELVSKNDGQEALEFLVELMDNDKPLPDLIFVDIHMPVMNGWEFLEHYGHINRKNNIPVYMLSSSVYDMDRARAKTFDTLKDFISKPIYVAQLAKIFENVLSSRPRQEGNTDYIT